MPVNIIDTIVPKNGGQFPVVVDNNVAGGFQVQPTTTARDAISVQNQKVGMLVYVTANTTYYTLTAVGSPGTWAVANLGGTTSLSGDVTGSTAANTVTKIQSITVSGTAPTNQQTLVFNGTSYVATGTEVVFNVKSFGAIGNGIANDTSAIAAANTAANASGGVVFIPFGNYVVTSVSFTAKVKFDHRAVLSPSGTVTFNNSVDASPLQQIFSNSATIVFNAGSVNEIWCNWWGAANNAAASINNAAITAALACWQQALQQNILGVAPELRLGPGNYPVSPASASARGPIFNLKNVNGGVFRGCGTGQTNIECSGGTSVQSPASVLRLTNCTFTEVRDMDFKGDTSGARNPALDVAAGATTITLAAGQGSTLTHPLQCTLYKFQHWYEVVNITGVTGDVITLDRPVHFNYSGNNADGTLNYIATGPIAMIECYSDATDPGFTAFPTNCRFTNMYLGSSAVVTCMYGIAINCNGGTGSASDGNNDNHTFTNIVTGNPVIGSLYIGHLNAVNETCINCEFAQGNSFYAIHAPQGGTASLYNCSLAAEWGLLALGGNNSHDWTVHGGLSESEGPQLVLANQYIPNVDFVVASFVQPAVSGTVAVQVNSTAWFNGQNLACGLGGYYTASIVDGTHLLLTNHGNAENALVGVTIPAGTNIGPVLYGATVYINGFDGLCGPQPIGITASAASGTNVLTVSKNTGLWFWVRTGMPVAISNVDGTLLEKNWVSSMNWNAGTITLRNNLTNNHTVLSGGFYGYIVHTYIGVDVSGFENSVAISGQVLGGAVSNVPGSELRMSDINTGQSASSLTLSSIANASAVGWTLDNATLNIFGCGFIAGANSSARETYLNSGRVGIGLAMYQSSANFAGFRPLGVAIGFDRLELSVVTTSASLYSAIYSDTTILVNRAGVVQVVAPIVYVGRNFTVTDISGAAGTNNITITPNAGELLNGTSSYVINTNHGSVTFLSDGTNWWATSKF